MLITLQENSTVARKGQQSAQEVFIEIRRHFLGIIPRIGFKIHPGKFWEGFQANPGSYSSRIFKNIPGEF